MSLPSPSLSEQNPVFDGHNDVLYQLWKAGDKKGGMFIDPNKDSALAITCHSAQIGCLKGGLFAIFVPARDSLENTEGLSEKPAFDHTMEMLDIAHYLHKNHSDAFRICQNNKDIKKASSDGAIAAVLHIEGAEAIGPSLDGLYALAQRGVRSIGPLWSRPNIFGQGVPFSFPGSPDQGSGLTQHGKALVKACDEAGIMLDVSHLNEAGFWDIARLSHQPITATHSNAHALCPSPRNLTDKQLAAIAESGGMVGVCFATAYLRADGARNDQTSLDPILRQIDYLLRFLGEDHVGLGSDFDGAVLPSELKTAAGLPALQKALQTHGFGLQLTQKLCWDNWLIRLSKCSGF